MFLPSISALYSHPVKPFRERGLEKINILPLKNSLRIEAYYIGFDTSKVIKRALFNIAEYSRREGDHGFTQFSTSEMIYHKEVYPFIICENDIDRKDIFGGGCFRYRKYKDQTDNRWQLQWVWLHPYARSKGIMAALWPAFLEKFGDFPVERPVSKDMKGFIKKYGTDYQRKYLGFSISE